MVGKHAYVEEFIEGKLVSAKGYSEEIPAKNNLKIANVLYAYDHPMSGQVFFLRFNHSVYLGSKKNDSLLCLDRCRANGVDVIDIP